MANTYTLIASNTLSSSAASVTFSSIPSTYTDLVLRLSTRTNAVDVANTIEAQISGDSSSNYSRTMLLGADGAVSSSRQSNSTTFNIFTSAAANLTTNTFGSIEVYLPSYTASQNKPISLYSVTETNATTDARIATLAFLWRNTSAISSLVFTPSGGNSFISGSSFFLYGIKNS